mmetsp:Transcript_20667/g.67159  ORF Transcript_20667/g.67159 Transcript_20667/m.67159 type:complete len:548 (+) Transcript_20667:394-2037(+)
MNNAPSILMRRLLLLLRVRSQWGLGPERLIITPKGHLLDDRHERGWARRLAVRLAGHPVPSRLRDVAKLVACASRVLSEGLARLLLDSLEHRIHRGACTRVANELGSKAELEACRRVVEEEPRLQLVARADKAAQRPAVLAEREALLLVEGHVEALDREAANLPVHRLVDALLRLLRAILLERTSRVLPERLLHRLQRVAHLGKELGARQVPAGKGRGAQRTHACRRTLSTPLVLLLVFEVRAVRAVRAVLFLVPLRFRAAPPSPPVAPSALGAVHLAHELRVDLGEDALNPLRVARPSVRLVRHQPLAHVDGSRDRARPLITLLLGACHQSEVVLPLNHDYPKKALGRRRPRRAGRTRRRCSRRRCPVRACGRRSGHGHGAFVTRGLLVLARGDKRAPRLEEHGTTRDSALLWVISLSVPAKPMRVQNNHPPLVAAKSGRRQLAEHALLDDTCLGSTNLRPLFVILEVEVDSLKVDRVHLFDTEAEGKIERTEAQESARHLGPEGEEAENPKRDAQPVNVERVGCRPVARPVCHVYISRLDAVEAQ